MGNENLPDWAITTGTITVVLVLPLIAVIFSMIWKRFQTHKEDIEKAHKLANEARDMGLIHQEQIKTLNNLAEKLATKDQLTSLAALIEVQLNSTNRLLENYNKTVESAKNALVDKHIDKEKRTLSLAEKVTDQNTALIKENQELKK